MEGFKSNPKMAQNLPCYKKGGAVYKSRHAEKSEMSEDIAQDKKIIKKAFSMHDAQEHKGEKTDLSKLRKGGRAKKDCGSVKKYKAGGEVTNVYEAKKSSVDLDNIQKTKDIKPAKAAAPSKAVTKPSFAGSDVAKEKSKPSAEKDLIKKVPPTGNKKADALSGAAGPDAFKKGGKVKKYSGEDGSYVTKAVDAVKSFGRDIKNNVMGTPEQNRIAQEDINKQAAKGSKLAKFFGGKADAESAPVNKCGGGKMKRGGKVC
jgi:hypothetical protein